MIALLRHLRADPPRSICVLLVLCLAVYFAVGTGVLYGKLDFSTDDLGTSEVSDFFAFYSAARFLNEGGTLAALYDPQALKAFQISLGAGESGLHPFNYPPHYALLIQPLAALPYAIALICWQWGTLALFTLSLRIAGLHWFAVLAAVAAPATIMNFVAAQNGFLTSALLLAGMVLATRKPLAAGALFGLLTVKPHLGLLVPLAVLAKRQWPAILSAVAVAAALAGLAGLAFGAQAWGDYLEFLQWFSARSELETGSRFLRYSASGMLAAQILQFSRPTALLLQAALSLPVLVCIYWAYRQRVAADLQLALILAGTALAIPYGFIYDLPFLAVAVVLVARRGLRDGFLPYEGLFALCVYLLPFAGPSLNQAGVPLAPVFHLVFFLYVLARVRRDLAAAPHPRRPAETEDAEPPALAPRPDSPPKTAWSG